MSSNIHFFKCKGLHASKTLCPTLHDPVWPDAVVGEQDCSHEHHGQSLETVPY